MKNYLPKNKFDLQSIEVLKSCSFDEIKPDIPILLEWMPDLHWEVADGIAAYLRPYVNEIKKELIFVLNSNDYEWIFNILVTLIGKSTEKLDPELIASLKIISENTIKSELMEEIDELVKEILK